MKNRRTTSFLGIVTVLGLGLVLSGCSATPTEVVTLDDLIGRLNIQLASVTGGSGAASSSSGVTLATPATTLEEPVDLDIHVPVPGTPGVFEWPVVLDLPISPHFKGHDIVLTWPTVDWPAFDLLAPEHRYFGHSGIVYWVNGRWNAISTEWLRVAREKEGVYYPYEEKFVEGDITDGDPIAFFIAGPWRHQNDDPEFRRRSTFSWYTWPSLEPFTWPGGGGETPPPGEPVVEEVHVYITGIKTQLSGGTLVDFEVEIGDVDLLSLRGQPIDVVNADVPVGTYEYVDFVVDPARSFLMVDGEQVDLGIPLQDIRINGPFVVGSDLSTSITLEFDPDNSLTQNADGSYTLNMVVVLIVGTG